MRKIYTEKQRLDLVVQANREGKLIETYHDTIEYEQEVFEYEKKSIEVPVYDTETYEPTGEFDTVEVDDLDKPIMIDSVDENGNPVKVHKSHKEMVSEIVENIRLIDNPNGLAMLKMTPLDFLKALLQLGISYETIKSIMEANPAVEMEMKYCQNVYRGHPMIAQFAAQYGISDEVLDNIFEKANGKGGQ